MNNYLKILIIFLIKANIYALYLYIICCVVHITINKKNYSCTFFANFVAHSLQINLFPIS